MQHWIETHSFIHYNQIHAILSIESNLSFITEKKIARTVDGAW